MTTQNLWDVGKKTVLRGKLIAIITYIKKKRPKINNVTVCLKELGKKLMTQSHQKAEN